MPSNPQAALELATTKLSALCGRAVEQRRLDPGGTGHFPGGNGRAMRCDYEKADGRGSTSHAQNRRVGKFENGLHPPQNDRNRSHSAPKDTQRRTMVCALPYGAAPRGCAGPNHGTGLHERFVCATWNHVLADELDLTTKATKDIGSFKGPTGSCDIRVEIISLGGFRVLSLPSKSGKRRRVGDVNSYAFTVTGELLYSVNAIYGSPGIYRFNCDSTNLRRLISPKHIDKAYPRGTDFFELAGVSHKRIIF